MTTFLTFHILTTLPFHNLNRNQNGQPKSIIDGATPRSYLSSQSLKRAARVAYREATAGRAEQSLRTSDAVGAVMEYATSYATERGHDLDVKAARKAATDTVRALYSGGKNTTKKTEQADGTVVEENTSKDSILLFATSELLTLAHRIVDNQINSSDGAVEPTEFIRDATSPALDVALFGRMFASKADLATLAAAAVTPAVTTHQMSLVTDYFTAVEERVRDHAGAAHIGLNFFTSGVYYRSVTIDTDQLRRSWSGYGRDGWEADLTDALTALLTALPTGKINGTNAHALPWAVLLEEQTFRHGYTWNTPAQANEDGGYEENSLYILAAHHRLALEAFDTITDAVVFLPSGHDNEFGPTPRVDTLTGLVSHAIDRLTRREDDGPAAAVEDAA